MIGKEFLKSVWSSDRVTAIWLGISPRDLQILQNAGYQALELPNRKLNWREKRSSAQLAVKSIKLLDQWSQ